MIVTSRIFQCEEEMVAQYATSGCKDKIIADLRDKLESVKTFYENLFMKITQTNVSIDDVRVMLRTEINSIGELKTQNDDTKMFISIDLLRDTVTESVKKHNVMFI